MYEGKNPLESPLVPGTMVACLFVLVSHKPREKLTKELLQLRDKSTLRSLAAQPRENPHSLSLWGAHRESCVCEFVAESFWAAFDINLVDFVAPPPLFLLIEGPHKYNYRKRNDQK